MAKIDVVYPRYSKTQGVIRNCHTTTLTLQQLLALLRKFNIVFYMTDAWPVYRSQLDSAHHIISKKYTQRIERHNMNLHAHLKRFTRRTICFSKSEKMHAKVISWYLTINHYH